MVKFIKKHRIGFSLLVVLLIVTSIWLYREYRAQVDRQDWRLFTIPMLSQTSKTSFEYKTDPYVRYYRCFKLVFKYGEILTQFNGNHLIFDNRRYNYYIASDQEFYSETIGKPHFKIKIIHQGKTEEKELYIMSASGRFFEVMNGKKTELADFRGYWAPRKSACYYFEPNSTYRIEAENDTPLEKFKGLEAFLLIHPDRLPKIAWENIN